MAVITVRGAVDPASLGRVLAHEHVLIDLYRVYQPHRDMYLHDVDLAVLELDRFAAAGGGAIVDLTTRDIGRRPEVLQQVSERTGLHIVMGAGRYREPFYEPGLQSRTTASLAAELVEEIENGDGGVRPGVIGEIGTDGRFVSALEERVHRAAARAAVSTGLPVVTHSLGSDVGAAQLDLFEEEGLAPSRVAVGHADTWPHHDYHLALLDRGAHLIFDTLRGRVPYETTRALRCFQVVVEAGFADRVLFSHDVCGTAHYASYGGEGYTYVGGRFLAEAEAFGIDPALVEAALTTTAQRFLDVAAG